MSYPRCALLLLLIVAGCASSAEPIKPAPHQRNETGMPASRGAEVNAGLSLDQIQPAPVLKTPSISGGSSGSPPLQAVHLFAQSRIAALDGDRLKATELLQQAVALDPGSFELHKSLADLYAEADDPRSLDQWQKAAAIEPDHLDLQLAIARQNMARSNFAGALIHLRLALQTRDYRHDTGEAAQADFMLARALERQGYDRAALQIYERLTARLQNPTMSLRRDPRIAALLAHPDGLALHIAALYEKHGSYAAAVGLLEPAAAAAPRNFELWAQIVRDRLAMHEREQAVRDATGLVSRFHASRDSLALLRLAAGSDAQATTVLNQLHQKHPEDRSLLYALLDSLISQGELGRAEQLLASAAGRWPDDLRLLRRQVDASRRAHDLAGAGRALIVAFARTPEAGLEIVPLWESLARPSAMGRLREADVEAISVPPGQEGAKLVLLAYSARLRGRSALEHEMLRRAAGIRPIFTPAWREMMTAIWADTSHTPDQKAQAAAELVGAAGQTTDKSLAAELRGQAALAGQKPEPAAIAFAQAVRAGDRSPELYLGFAAALHLLGDNQAAEALLARLLKERPLCDGAYLELYTILDDRHQQKQAEALLEAWLANDPDSAEARRLEVRAAIQQRHFAEAQRILLDLLEHHDDDPQVLAAVHSFYSETSRLDELASNLDRRFNTEPWNFSLGELLAQIYQQQHHPAQALAAADKLRSAVADDPDLLYELSALYTRLGREQESESALRAVLKLDPSYAGANNDLGYLLAERGRNLTQAEELVRKALTSEPDNPSFLDSMGWVLYKRGRFDQALQQLSRAANPLEQADPQVLDHLGDTLYRLGDRQKAARQWQQAAQKLTELNDNSRDELKALRTVLIQKQQQFNAGGPVNVAPVGENQ